MASAGRWMPAARLMLNNAAASANGWQSLGRGGLNDSVLVLADYHAALIAGVAGMVAGSMSMAVTRGGASLVLVSHDPAAYDWFYNVVANPALWFLQHSLWALANTPGVDRAFHVAWDQGYTVVNEGFAAAVLTELEQAPDAAVFFHDYHLYLAPRMVREARARVVVLPETALPAFLDQLPPDERRLLQVGAVFGRSFRPAGIAAPAIRLMTASGM